MADLAGEGSRGSEGSGASGSGGAVAAPRRRRGRRLFDARAEGAVVRALRGGKSVAAAARAAGFSVSTLYAARARSALFREAWDEAVAEGDGEVLIAPGNGRKVQLRRVRRRLFTAKLQDSFLLHFSGTCCIASAAAEAGVGRSTVNKHLAENADFRARFDRVLEFAYRELDSEMVRQRLEAARRPQTDGDEAFRTAEFERSLALLREHKRARKGALEPLAGAVPRQAGLDEVCEALAKRLKKFPPTVPDPGPGEAAGEEEAPERRAPGEGA